MPKFSFGATDGAGESQQPGDLEDAPGPGWRDRAQAWSAGALGVRGLRNQTQKYRRFLRWMWRWAFWPARMRIAAILTTELLAVALQVNTIALIIWYAYQFAEGATLEWGGRSVDTRESVPLLLGVGAAACVLLLIAGGLAYFARSRLFMLRVRLSQWWAKRGFEALAATPRVAPLSLATPQEKSVVGIVRSDANYAGRVFQLMLSTIVPAIAFSAAVVALLWINWPLTTLLLVLMGLAGLLFYHTSLRGARASLARDEYGSKAGREFSGLAGAERRALHPLSANRKQREKIFQRGAASRYYDAFIGRLVAVPESELAGNLFLAMAVFALTAVLGWSIISEGTGWWMLAVYLVALRYALVMYRTLGQQVTSLNRFYPQARRCSTFLENAETCLSRARPPRDAYELRAAAPVIDDSARSAAVGPGDRIIVATRWELDRFSVPFLLEAMLGHDLEQLMTAAQHVRMVTADYENQGSALRETLGLDAACTWADVGPWIDHPALARFDAAALPRSLDERIDPARWASVPAALKLALTAAAAVHQGDQWIVVSAQAWRIWPDAYAEAVRQAWHDRIQVTVHARGALPALDEREGNWVAIESQRQLAGLGTVAWARAQAEAIQRVLSGEDQSERASSATQAGATQGSATDLDLDE